MEDRPLEPVEGSPLRRPGSARRTTTIDMTWTAPAVLELDCRARDARTADGASLVVLERTALHAGVAAGVLASLDLDPPVAAAATLVGAPVGAGFRARLPAVVGEAGGAGLVGLLLDDLPVAALVGGYARIREDSRVGERADAGGPGAADRMRDLCSGWRAGGTLLTALEAGRGVPLQDCPPARPLVDPLDPIGWHDVPELRPGSMRRTRRIDVWREGEELRVDAMFRDSYGEPGGDEVVLHEYQVRARVGRDGAVADVEAVPRVLPYAECPAAAASVPLLAGVPVGAIAHAVRERLAGTISCTHLNDLLRSLRGVPQLVSAAG